MPLVVPLVILVFIAAYMPLIGILVVGALAIVVTLATKGWIAAVILLAVFLVENQIESHLLQPLVVGRIVRLHPLADHRGPGGGRYRGRHSWRDHRGAGRGRGLLVLAVLARRS